MSDWQQLSGYACYQLNRGGLSYSQIAKEYGVTRGMVAAKIRDYRNQNFFAQLRTATGAIEPATPSGRRLRDLAHEGQMQWDQALDHLSRLDRLTKLAFVADIHLPHQYGPAVELAAQVVEAFNPDILTAWNDVFDFNGLGRWERDDAIWERLWDGDIQNVIDAHAANMAIWRMAAPCAVFPVVVGNHDYRLVKYLFLNVPNVAEWALHNFLTEIISHGPIWLGMDRAFIEVGNHFVIMHGKYYSKNRTTVARNSAEMFGYQRSGMCGHCHDFGVYRHPGPDYATEFHSIGCLCDLDPHWDDYPMRWSHGIGLAHVDLTTPGCTIMPVPFIRKGSRLVAHFGGKEYSVRAS